MVRFKWNGEEMEMTIDEFKIWIKKIERKSLHKESIERAKNHIKNLTMPYWALGDILDIGVKLSGIQRVFPPKIKTKKVFIFAGDHGITQEGVSCFPKEVTKQMVANFMAETAAISVLSKHEGADVFVVDAGVDGELAYHEKKFIQSKINFGTKNFLNENAMSKEEAFKSLFLGFSLVEKHHFSTDVFSVGEMGIGNTTTSTAMASALMNESVNEMTGTGTGISEEQRQHKVKVIEESLKNREILNEKNPLVVLEKVGGFEIGAIAGMILGSAYYNKAVIVDGFISSVGALLASKINPDVLNYMFIAHESVEPGHKKVVKELTGKTLFNFNMRLGEGSGTPFAMNILEASCRILSEMATFESASVSQKNE